MGGCLQELCTLQRDATQYDCSDLRKNERTYRIHVLVVAGALPVQGREGEAAGGSVHMQDGSTTPAQIRPRSKSRLNVVLYARVLAKLVEKQAATALQSCRMVLSFGVAALRT